MVVYRYHQDFRDWLNPSMTEYLTTFNTSGIITSDSNPAAFITPPAQGHMHLYDGAMSSVFGGGEIWTMTARFKPVTSPENTALEMAIYCYDGTRYVSGILLFAFTSNVIFYSQSGTDINKAGIISQETYLLENTGVAASPLDQTWNWIKVVKDANDNFTFFYALNQITKPTDAQWVYASDVDQTVVMGDLDSVDAEFGVSVFMPGGSSGAQTQNADDLEIITGDITTPQPVANTLLGTKNFTSVFARNQVGQIGDRAVLEIENPNFDWSQVADIKNSQRTVMTVSETANYNIIFMGEIDKVDPAMGLVEGGGAITKLKDTQAATNPVIYEGVVEYIVDNVLYKRANGSESTDAFPATLDDKLIVFVKNDYRKQTYYPVSYSFEKPDGTSQPEGSMDDVTPSSAGLLNVFYHIASASYAENVKALSSKDNLIHIKTVFTFEIFAKTGATINLLELKAIVQWGELKKYDGGSKNPFVYIYNYTTSSWVELADPADYVDKNSNAGTHSVYSEGMGPLIEINKIFPSDLPSGVLSDYLSAGSDNNSSFTPYAFKIAVTNSASSLREWQTTHLMEVIAHTTTDNALGVGVAKIQSHTADSLTFYAHSGLGWTTVDPDEDGVCAGDSFFVTKDIPGIAADIMTNSGLTNKFTLNWVPTVAASDTNEIPDISDMTFESVKDVFQRWSQIYNAIYFADYSAIVDPTTDKPVITFTAAPNSTGITFAAADIENFPQPGSITYSISSQFEKEELQIVGGLGISATLTLTPADTQNMGDEQLLIVNSELRTQRQLDASKTALQAIHENPQILIQFDVNLSNGVQNYAALKKGETVALTIPSLCDYSSGGTDGGELLIIGYELRRNQGNGFKDIVTLTLQERH